MMAFYKLFHIVHRRTDFYQMWRRMNELMYPEFYAKQRARVHQRVNEIRNLHRYVMGLYDRNI